MFILPNYQSWTNVWDMSNEILECYLIVYYSQVNFIKL